MKSGFYLKLASQGIRKNKKFYLPYILTCICMILMYYIIDFLSVSDTIDGLRGGSIIIEVLHLGSIVIIFFAALFLFYTNSFLIKKRTKEFGLYNILGMGKGNIARILIWETIICAFISLAAGIAGGFILSKLFELGLIRMMHGKTEFSMDFSVMSAVRTAAFFAVIFAAILILNLIRTRLSNPTELLKGDKVGEKAPKANWFLGIIGVCILAAAYYAAVSIEDPVSALVYFFVAVIMVITATYLIFISGSVVLCRILQKNKKYYYRPNHFVSVSQMVYRMKRNGAGLASICILSTMVLVMLSSTASMYFGTEDSLLRRYPGEVNFEIILPDCDALYGENLENAKKAVDESATAHSAVKETVLEYRSVQFYAAVKGDYVELDPDRYTVNDTPATIVLVPIEDYNRQTGENETLSEGEALIYAYKTSFSGDKLSFSNGVTLSVKKELKDAGIISGDAVAKINSTLYVIVDGKNTLSEFNEERFQSYFNYSFNTGIEPNSQNDLCISAQDALFKLRDEGEISKFTWNSRELEREDFYAMNGGLFFLGIILSIVFIFAAVLIIYYKQVSEGYEDAERFEIMQKVGMTKKEIRKSINSQLLTVFFLPLIGAGCHLIFAFPMVRQILLAFALNNIKLFIIVNMICFIIFSACYAVIYKITSNAYCDIVSQNRED